MPLSTALIYDGKGFRNVGSQRRREDWLGDILDGDICVLVLLRLVSAVTRLSGGGTYTFSLWRI
jgi:hypothetical protein